MQAGCLRYKSLVMTINIKHWLGLSMFVIALDQLTKLWVVGVFQYGDSLPLLSFFNLVHARNSGAAFSFLAGEGGWQRFFFIGIALAASLLIVHLLRKHSQERGFCFALSLILGGALGNLIDRVRFGYVIDFLDFYYAGYHFPAFNVADSAITVGAALLIWDSLRKNAKGCA
ncbi:MAG: lipoprotein signal peptidase [Burkholderiales bacterium]|nr:lipoprotein signal peptidase [Burkholderiales bacterium]